MSVAKETIVLLICAAALTACGKPEPLAPATATAPVAASDNEALANARLSVPATAAPVALEHANGKRAFDKTCGLCHGAGVGGAPRPGDKASWAPRIAQGVDTLYQHALEGFSGATGYMPARGGDPKVTDAEVKAGVDYMVAVSQ